MGAPKTWGQLGKKRSITQSPLPLCLLPERHLFGILLVKPIIMQKIEQRMPQREHSRNSAVGDATDGCQDVAASRIFLLTLELRYRLCMLEIKRTTSIERSPTSWLPQ